MFPVSFETQKDKKNKSEFVREYYIKKILFVPMYYLMQLNELRVTLVW